MTEVTRTRLLDATPDEVWRRIGNFADPSWHPVIESTDVSNEGRTRTLHLPDGAAIVESLVGEAERSYTYRIDDGPLPVADYTATLSVSAANGGSEARWEASFRPEGASEEEAAGAIGGIFDAGLGAL